MPIVLNTAVKFDYCPIRWVEEEAQREVLVMQDVLRFRKHKILPSSGGLNDQDCLFIEAEDIISNEISVLEEALNGNK